MGSNVHRPSHRPSESGTQVRFPGPRTRDWRITACPAVSLHVIWLSIENLEPSGWLFGFTRDDLVTHCC